MLVALNLFASTGSFIGCANGFEAFDSLGSTVNCHGYRAVQKDRVYWR